MSELIAVEIDDAEYWPCAHFTSSDSDYFNAQRAVNVPAALVNEIRAARRAEADAEKKLAQWLREHEPATAARLQWVGSA